ncbi:hypothetical protein CDAR_259591 [Caerostris darwini]|uniref:Uncharacterized protein n=1 Tax=Caerostris darwini TaxID=1538125 RepID=A0AAV4VP97_9ARAC|nr:hypothetical protein CDAR_259591 [Caerostris darwini]
MKRYTVTGKQIGRKIPGRKPVRKWVEPAGRKNPFEQQGRGLRSRFLGWFRFWAIVLCPGLGQLSEPVKDKRWYRNRVAGERLLKRFDCSKEVGPLGDRQSLGL